MKFALKLPWNSCEIGQFFREFVPKNPAKFDFFFHNLSEALLRVAFIPGCMFMLKVGKNSPGLLNSIQQKFQFEISLIPHAQHFNFNNSKFRCTDPTQATACYCSCKQDTKEQYWGQQFCQMERDILVQPTKMTPVKVDHLQSWSRIFRSDQTKKDHSIWSTNWNFRNFGLNGNKAPPWTPLSGGYWGLPLGYIQLIYPTTFSCFCWNFVTHCWPI